MKELIVEEFTVREEDVIRVYVGQKYSYFKDPETGKYYRPSVKFHITGDLDADCFVEVE